MPSFAYFKTLLVASLGILAGITPMQQGKHIAASVGSFLYHATARDVRVVNEFTPVTTERSLRITLAEPSAAPSASPVLPEKKNNEKAKVLGVSISPTLKPKPLSIPLPSSISATPTPTPSTSSGPTATPLATPSPSPAPTPQPTPTPHPSPEATEGAAFPSPDFIVGTLLIGGNPAQVLTGDSIKFSVFVRDANGTTIKNKTLTFSVNQKAIIGTTDSSGNAYLEFPTAKGSIGKLVIIVQLGEQQTSFTVDIADTKPDLNLSSFAFTQVGYHVRLRNALGDYIPNWQVTAYRRDGSVLGTERTNELGVIEFPLPAREDGGHMYACAEVQDVGRKCTDW